MSYDTENNQTLPQKSIVDYFTSLKRMLANMTLQPANLNGSDQRPLARLATTDKTDPTIALLDVWAVVIDVLNFYQQQIDKENYLATSTELFSVRQLARAVGYELSPGVAASTSLAFMVDGNLDPFQEIKVPKGTKILSVPGQDEMPQTFETSQELSARGIWNELYPKIPLAAKPIKIARIQNPNASLRLQGINTGLRTGDMLLLTGIRKLSNGLQEPLKYSVSVDTVKTNDELGFTTITWNDIWAEETKTVAAVSLPFYSPIDVIIVPSSSDSPTVELQLNGYLEHPFNEERPISISFLLPDNTIKVLSGKILKIGRPPRPPNIPQVSAVLSFEQKLLTDWSMLQNKSLIISGFVRQTNQGANFWYELEQINVFAFRKRAASFGNNAPRYDSLKTNVINSPTGPLLPPAYAQNWDQQIPSIWETSQSVRHREADIYLDQLTPEILPSQWLICANNKHRQIFKVNSALDTALADYGLSGRVTGIKLSAYEEENTLYKNEDFDFRSTSIYAQSEPLQLYTEMVEVTAPIGGEELESQSYFIELNKTVTGLRGGHNLVISNLTQDVSEDISVDVDRDLTTVIIKIFSPLKYRYQAGTVTISNELIPPISVTVKDEQTLYINYIEEDFSNLVSMTNFKLTGRLEAASEVFTILSSEDIDGRTRLLLSQKLQNKYCPSSCVIYGNVVQATHGETITEILGSGDSAQANQRFTLKKLPLTYISAATPTGIKSTLEVRVNGILWHEAPNLLDLKANDKNYVIQHGENNVINIIFGDGIHGARLPTGQENIQATYRAGIGLQGQLSTNSLSLLQTQPLGIKSVTNPVPAMGAADPESIQDAKEDAPLVVKTLDRIVSARDFENFARAFTGISKSQVTVLKSNRGGALHVTIAGANGSVIPESSAIYKNFIKAIEKIRNPGRPVKVQSYNPKMFNISAKLLINSDYLKELVFNAAKQTLLDHFSSAKRDFGQSVTASEISELLQKIEGVIAVDIDSLYFSTEIKELNSMLVAKTVNVIDETLAELLTINPFGIDLIEMNSIN